MQRSQLLMVLLIMAITVPVFAQSVSHANNGLTASIRTNKSRYEPGEPMDLTFTLLNSGDRALRYDFANTPIYDIWITTSEGKEVWRLSKGKPFVGTQTLMLNQNAVKIYNNVWNQVDSQGKKVSSGWYEVFAQFNIKEKGIETVRTRIKIDNQTATNQQPQIVIMVLVNSEYINLRTDIGRPVTLDGVLRQGPDGVYLDVSSVKVKR
jgi:hypothetical protein